jgi:hypothetical protein
MAYIQSAGESIMDTTDKKISALYRNLETIADEHYTGYESEVLRACDYVIAMNLDYRLPGPISYNRDTNEFTGFQAQKNVIGPKQSKPRPAGVVMKELMAESDMPVDKTYEYFCFSRAKISHQQNVATPAWNNMMDNPSQANKFRATREDHVNQVMGLLVLQCVNGVARDEEAASLVETIVEICNTAADNGLSAPDVFRVVCAPETIKPV